MSNYANQLLELQMYIFLHVLIWKVRGLVREFFNIAQLQVCSS